MHRSLRLDHMGPDRFDIYWMRHTGQWWPLHKGLTLAASLRMIEEDEHLHPDLTFTPWPTSSQPLLKGYGGYGVIATLRTPSR